MKKDYKVKDRSGIEDEMRRLFSGFAQMRHGAMLHAVNLWHPPTDVYETDNELVIVCELAGVEKKNIMPLDIITKENMTYHRLPNQ